MHMYMCVYLFDDDDDAENGNHSKEDQSLALKDEEGTDANLPEAVMHYIERDNAMFEDWIQDIVLTRVSLCHMMCF